MYSHDTEKPLFYIIKCIFNPSIYVVDKNFGITYKVVALQVFENTIPKIDYKAKQIVVPLISARIDAINDKDPKVNEDRATAINLIRDKGI